MNLLASPLGAFPQVLDRKLRLAPCVSVCEFAGKWVVVETVGHCPSHYRQ